jgi:hypothetical protein
VLIANAESLYSVTGVQIIKYFKTTNFLLSKLYYNTAKILNLYLILSYNLKLPLNNIVVVLIFIYYLALLLSTLWFFSWVLTSCGRGHCCRRFGGCPGSIFRVKKVNSLSDLIYRCRSNGTRKEEWGGGTRGSVGAVGEDMYTRTVAFVDDVSNIAHVHTVKSTSSETQIYSVHAQNSWWKCCDPNWKIKLSTNLLQFQQLLLFCWKKIIL